MRHDRPVEQRQRGGELVTQDCLHSVARPRAVRHFGGSAESHDLDRLDPLRVQLGGAKCRHGTVRETTRCKRFHSGVGEFPPLAEIGSQGCRRTAAHHLQHAPTAVEHAARACHTRGGECRRSDAQFGTARAIERGVEHRAVVLVLAQTDGGLAREAQCRRGTQGIEPAGARRGGSGAKGRRGAGAMKTGGVMRGAQCRRHPRCRFIARKQRREEPAPRRLCRFRAGQRRRDHRTSWMRRTCLVRVIEGVDARV